MRHLRLVLLLQLLGTVAAVRLGDDDAELQHHVASSSKAREEERQAGDRQEHSNASLATRFAALEGRRVMQTFEHYAAAAPTNASSLLEAQSAQQSDGKTASGMIFLGILVVAVVAILCCRDGVMLTPNNVEASPPPDQYVFEDDGLDWPKTLIVTSAHGHAGCYHLVPGRRPNGLPLWKHETSNDWIFCSNSGQWLIGDESEEALNFECDTGNIASYEVHAGRMPDEIGPGGWLFFDGTGWKSVPDINVTSEYFTLADQEATQDKQNLSAMKIQSNFRGKRDRQKVQSMRDQKKRRQSAASLIGANFRGKQAREKLAKELEGEGKEAPKAMTTRSATMMVRAANAMGRAMTLGRSKTVGQAVQRQSDKSSPKAAAPSGPEADGAAY
eukprot:TRINITY_DN47631_c0_g1_i1.p1 TRINITY_DN47631_c0_g1~~TRINITY_DN47631_c0_g1_i1.p1  ORF type:complete len:387 (-),score=96.84 TRINITY_DN47631_c0_g1_i1:61-1221(-)